MIKQFSIALIFATILMSGCKKDDCEGISCMNGGALNSESCTCNCPSGFSGLFCETDTRPACVRNNTGKVAFDNWEEDAYYCYVNNVMKGTVPAYGYAEFDAPAGSIIVKAVQMAGYVVYASEYTGSGTLSQCGTSTFEFP
jgi:hypothetical protein